jgi:hypothetical protein
MIPSQVLLRVDVRGYHPGVVARLLHLCRLGLDGAVPDHSTFSKNRHGRFRDSDLLRKVFATTVERCIAEGLVGGEVRGRCQHDQGRCQLPAIGAGH